MQHAYSIVAESTMFILNFVSLCKIFDALELLLSSD